MRANQKQQSKQTLMYTFSPNKDQSQTAPVRKRDFKFQRKSDRRDFKICQQLSKVSSASKNQADEIEFEMNWPKEIEPIMTNIDAEERIMRIEKIKQGVIPLSESGKSAFSSKSQKQNRFFSICDKVKAYILVQNFCQVVEKYTEIRKAKNASQCSTGMFHRALAEWRLSKLFSFRDAASVTSNKDLIEQINKLTVEFGSTEEDYKALVDQTTTRDLLELVDTSRRVSLCWKELRDKVVNQLAVFDSNHFCKNLKPDRVLENQVIIRFQNTDQQLPEQLDRAITQLLKAVQDKYSEANIRPVSGLSNCLIYVVFHFQALSTCARSFADQMPTRLVSHSIDFRKLVYAYMQMYASKDKRLARYRLMHLLGLDEQLPFEGSIAGIYSDLKIVKLSIQFFQVPSFYRKQHDSVPLLNRKLAIKEPDLIYDAKMMLYAISRARVQYLGSCVPLFRFKHCLFEALITSIHESELRPAQPEHEVQNYSTAHKLSRAEERNSYYQLLLQNNEILQDPITHERFLLRKYLEFMSHPPLKALLLHSIRGETMQFVESFNRLTQEECPMYSKFKISLYDINQRKFIVQAHTTLLDDNDDAGSQSNRDYGIGGSAGIQPFVGSVQAGAALTQLKEVYIVHYNGYVFGANFAKMLIIREREAKQDSQSNDFSEYSESVDSQDSQSHSNHSEDEEQDLANVVKVEEQQPDISTEQMNDYFNRAVFEKLNFVNSASETSSQQEKQAEDQIFDQGLAIRSGFSLAAQAMTQRQKKYLYREKRKNKDDVPSFKNLVGLMAIKIQFAKELTGVPSRLICYGSLPLRNTQMLKIFEGPTCHVKFILWALQNVTDYKVDNRTDQTMLNVFTIGGSSKELPVLLRGFVQVAGRDVHFFGDINRVKCLWHDNIKVYDLANYFETANIPVLAQMWLRANKKEVLRANAPGDKQVRDVLLTYELASKFLREMQTIQFKDNKLDFMVHQQATSGSLALTIYQQFYLDSKVQIRGTLEEEHLQKERQSIVSPYLLITHKTCQTALNAESLQSFDFSKNMIRLYKMNRIMSQIHLESPIPYMIKDHQPVNFSYNASKSQKLQQLEHKPRYCYRVSVQHSGATDSGNLSNTKHQEEFQFLYSSLYRVSHLRYKPLKEHAWAHLWRVHRDTIDPSDKNDASTVLTDRYMWGVELISGLLNHSIDRLQITEEINYYQSRLFQHFTQDLCEKRQKAQDKCQQDILEMVLDNFTTRFGQKSYNVQSVVHVNDLKLLCHGGRMAASEQQQAAQIQPRKLVKILDFGSPFYYTEFKQRDSDKVQQIGSLCRITGYLNAVARVKLMQSLDEVAIQNVVYLDNQFLAVKNAALTQKNSFTNIAHAFNLTELGKWQLLLESQMQTNVGSGLLPLNQSMVCLLKEILMKPININFDQTKDKNCPIESKFKKFIKLFEPADETILFQKYLTFLANKAYFDQAGNDKGKLFAREFDAKRSPKPEELDALAVDQPEKVQIEFDGSSVITLECQNDMQAEIDQAFIDAILKDEQHTAKTIQRFQKAIRNFETQFADGQMEAVVYDSRQQPQDEETDTYAATKAHDLMIQQVFGPDSLANPAYPVSHPANMLGNLAEYGFVSSKEDLQKLPKPPLLPKQNEQTQRWKQPKAQEMNRALDQGSGPGRQLGQNSPTALSSRSSNSFTTELIAQKFGLDANDPMFAGDDQKGSLISLFFSQPQKKF